MLEFDIELQRQIITAALDDLSPNSVLPNTYGGQYGNTPHAWRNAVIEFIRHMLVAGLIAPLQGLEGYQSKSVEHICHLLEYGDSENDFDVELTWDIIHFGGTVKLTELVKRLKLNTWDARNNELSIPLGKALAEMMVVKF